MRLSYFRFNLLITDLPINFYMLFWRWLILLVVWMINWIHLIRRLSNFLLKIILRIFVWTFFIILGVVNKTLLIFNIQNILYLISIELDSFVWTCIVLFRIWKYFLYQDIRHVLKLLVWVCFFFVFCGRKVLFEAVFLIWIVNWYSFRFQYLVKSLHDLLLKIVNCMFIWFLLLFGCNDHVF